MLLKSGSQYFSSASLTNAGAYPTRVFNLSTLTGTTAGIVKLRNGGATGDIYVTLNVAASNGANQDFGEQGVLFPDGCWVGFGGASAATIEYAKEF